MLTKDTAPGSQLRSIFQSGTYYSQKITSFFQVYEDLFSGYVGKPITFVEVGVSQGGSLFMWREYFGPQARIIGVELNPAAKKWEKDGFEIFIGDQGDPAFWSEFFAKVGPVDILLDDGGHTNLQQVVTVSSAVDHVNDGGLILIEDVHTSYMSIFGNPSRYSFVNFAKTIVDKINSRMDRIEQASGSFFRRVYSVAFYESMVAFHIDSRKAFVSTTIDNGGQQAGAQDMRILAAATSAENFARRNVAFLKDTPLVRPIGLACFSFLRTIKRVWVSAKSKRALKSYFK